MPSSPDHHPVPSMAGQRTGLGILLALVVAAAYYGFLALGAFAPQWLARPAVGHVPWSFLLGAGLLVTAFGSTGIYVLLADAGEKRAGATP